MKESMHKALFWEKYEKREGVVKCTLCPHFCLIQDGKAGACAIRVNKKGELYTLVYGRMIAGHVDPIEKKPLFHFYPGSSIYSYATAGCNMKCSFCQNWDISQVSKGSSGEVFGKSMSPEEIVKDAIRNGCNSVAMTYNEPSIQFEYALDVCREAKKKGLKTVFVSNGYISQEACDKISKYLDAINIDLKAFSDEFYKKVTGSRLQPVLDSIKRYHKNGVFMEITTLVIPGENDSPEELKDIATFIASVDKNIPWHVSRFHPDYKMRNKERTSMKSLEIAYDAGKKAGLNYVYVGNVHSDERESTYCPACGKCVIERRGFRVIGMEIIDGKCGFCKNRISGCF